MYSIQGKNYEYFIGVQVGLSDSTVQYREWLSENVGREYQDWTMKMVNINFDGFTLLIFLHAEEHVALFKLAML